jgi:hypothetical protein
MRRDRRLLERLIHRAAIKGDDLRGVVFVREQPLASKFVFPLTACFGLRRIRTDLAPCAPAPSELFGNLLANVAPLDVSRDRFALRALESFVDKALQLLPCRTGAHVSISNLRRAK